MNFLVLLATPKVARSPRTLDQSLRRIRARGNTIHSTVLFSHPTKHYAGIDFLPIRDELVLYLGNTGFFLVQYKLEGTLLP